MSEKHPQNNQKKPKNKFREWMSGEKDPFIGTMEMQPQKEPEDPERFYREAAHEKLRKRARDHKKNRMWTGYNKRYIVSSIIICLFLIGILIYAVVNLPTPGAMGNPTNNEVPQRYIEQGLQETGAVNIVSGMIFTYRAFDTFGETMVLFIATCCVMLMLMVENHEKRKELKLDDFGREPLDDTILKVISTILCPIIFLFGIYVILNGHLSPGGGFSGGAVIGAGMILYSAAFGFENTQKFFNEKIYVIIKVTALLVYGLMAIYFFFTGAGGFSHIFPLGIPGHILSGGIILPINICVGTEVACTIYAFYALFRRGGL